MRGREEERKRGREEERKRGREQENKRRGEKERKWRREETKKRKQRKREVEEAILIFLYPLGVPTSLRSVTFALST